MPMFSEVGPLIMDEDVLAQAQEQISQDENDRKFFVHIKSTNVPDLTSFSLPIK